MAFLLEEIVFIAVVSHQVKKMNIYESRKVMPESEMHSAGSQSDSWPMPEEPGRQINKADCEGVIGFLRTRRVL